MQMGVCARAYSTLHIHTCMLVYIRTYAIQPVSCVSLVCERSVTSFSESFAQGIVTCERYAQRCATAPYFTQARTHTQSMSARMMAAVTARVSVRVAQRGVWSRATVAPHLLAHTRAHTCTHKHTSSRMYNTRTAPEIDRTEGDVNLSPARMEWQHTHLNDDTKALLEEDAKYFLHQVRNTQRFGIWCLLRDGLKLCGRAHVVMR